MAKRRKRSPQDRKPEQNVKTDAELAEDAETLAEGAKEAAGHDDSPDVASPKGTLSSEDLRSAVHDARTARQTYDSLAEAARSELAEIESRAHALETERSRVEVEAKAIEAAQQALDERERGLDERTRELDEREERLKTEETETKAKLQARQEALDEREAEAAAGFLARRDQIIGPVRDQIDHLTAGWQEKHAQLVAELDRELQARTDAYRASIDELREDLESERAELFKERSALEERVADLLRREAELDLEREMLRDDRVAFEETRERLRAEAADDVAMELQEARERAQSLASRLDALRSERDAARQLTAELGEPQAILQQMDELRRRNQTLQEEIRRRPDASIIDELADVREQVGTLRNERESIARAKAELERQLEHQNVELIELERIAGTNNALQATVAAYKAELENLSQRLNDLRLQVNQQSVFPECSRMDEKYGSRTAGECVEPGHLPDFVDYLQLAMADAGDGRRLHYRKSDIRTFLAGLSTSRLHLLEGVSGTGKTTFPHAFAAAVGGGVKKIEVQAGWRDKQDLLGYYNSFERIYRETPCLQYLYRASLPVFTDRLVFIVLDEMNLSHPEQYFADFLSALEDPKPDKLISLVDRGLPDVPERMVEEAGVQIPLPPNVWFVGTANQDETTFGFAPKTYDRAHVMELEPGAPEVPEGPPYKEMTISHAELEAAFGRAREDHVKEANKASEVVAELADFFQERFRVGWGHRTDVQLRSFVSVYVASAGSSSGALGEALDHFISSKLIKKIQGRHSLKQGDLEELRQWIEDLWPDGHRPPNSTNRKIDHEVRSLVY